MARVRRFAIAAWRLIVTGVKFSIMVGVLWLVWSASFYIAGSSVFWEIENQGDLATVLFGATSIALFIISIFIAIVAVVGWQTAMNTVKATAIEATATQLKPLEDEIKGRLFTSLGYAIGESAMEQGSMDPVDRARLHHAIELCQAGYSHLQRVKGPSEYTALNNLVFYTTAQGKRDRVEFLLESARRLLRAGQEHDVERLQLTACRAILTFTEKGEKGGKERRRAFEILSELAKNSRSEWERKEAQLYLDFFPR